MPKQSPAEIEIASVVEFTWFGKLTTLSSVEVLSEVEGLPRNDKTVDHILKRRFPSNMHNLIWTRVNKERNAVREENRVDPIF